ncbi:metal-dependent hydrolase [Microbacterium protaetiae]|uniref:Metal-dependent hydrolase n=1 Tax=Microbacterium protaetiae TaxID=2509458 RepID=A0A4P6EUE0_9MICO|nr:metal-dependent hydrolase [Microbacterium protaetiae]
MNDDVRADLVLRGGRVHVLDAQDTRAQAIAIGDGRILAVGADTDIEPYIDAGTDVVELEGRAVLPGINDSHLHASWLGGMWPDTVFGAGGPREGALVHDDAQRREAILRAGEVIASLGITSYTEPGIGPGEDDGPTGSFGQPVLDLYRTLDAEGLLRARVNLLLVFGLIDGPARTQAILDGIRDADTTVRDPARFRIAGVKIFGDGIPPMRNAYIHGRYDDGTHGALLLDGGDDDEREAHLRTAIVAAHEAGLQVAVHATGDRTIDVVVDAVRRAVAQHPADLRHYVVHADLLPRDTAPLLAEAGMGATIQAGIAAVTSEWAAAATGGPVPTPDWPARALFDAGVPFTLSSDAPVLPPDWRTEIAAADRLLGPAADARARLHELLRRYTAVPAWQDHAESWKGTLEPGKVADLAVLSDDPDAVGAQGLPTLRIERTYLGGEVVYDAASAPIATGEA